MAEDIVKLNVGGTHYQTTRTTLCQYPESMLGAMFSGDQPKSADRDHRYFIDRDGTLFIHVLNFLRSHKLTLPADFADIERLSAEADFYQIAPLCQAIAQRGRPASVHHLEVVEFRSGSTATMPTNNSRVKTIVNAPGCIMARISRRLGLSIKPHAGPFAEASASCSNARLKIGDWLHNTGWRLISSDVASSTGYDAKAAELVITQTFRDRWLLEGVDDWLEEHKPSSEESETVVLKHNDLDAVSTCLFDHRVH